MILHNCNKCKILTYFHYLYIDTVCIVNSPIYYLPIINIGLYIK